MTELIQLMIAIGAALSGVAALFMGLAKLRMADAWKIWATRCDPMNPSFHPPQLPRSSQEGEH